MAARNNPLFADTFNENSDFKQTLVEASGEEGFHETLFDPGATVLEGSSSGPVVSPSALAPTLLPTGDDGKVDTASLGSVLSKRTTVLPKAQLRGEVPTLHVIPRDRYEQLKDLGEGASGDVALAKDNDIQRLVALKRLKKEHHVPATLARFVEEIQTVGQLEHPHIVPIHDVGIDETGQYYFVMKYVEGQNMADIIERLREGDEETHEAYPFDVRNQIFLKILQAIQFAHKNGIIHRDLKPENIMIGSCGQVMVMDWGIAKKLKAPHNGNAKAPCLKDTPKEQLESIAASEQPDRLFETRAGTLIGTPGYMAPEQALARNDLVDERSDIYSLCALYYEWMSLTHYLQHKSNFRELFFGIIEETPKHPSFLDHPHQPPTPAEFGHFVLHGLRKDANERFQTIEEMIMAFQMTLAGKFAVKCPMTLVKRGGNGVLGFIDRHPKLSTYMLLGLILGGLAGLISFVVGIVT